MCAQELEEGVAGLGVSATRLLLAGTGEASSDSAGLQRRLALCRGLSEAAAAQAAMLRAQPESVPLDEGACMHACMHARGLVKAVHLFAVVRRYSTAQGESCGVSCVELEYRYTGFSYLLA